MQRPTPPGFAFLDGERLVRWGPGALGDAAELLRTRGFVDYALLTTPRHRDSAPDLARGAAAVLDVPSAPVPEAAAVVRGAVAGRPVVALGGGRVVDCAKAIAAADGLLCAAVPTTLSGAEMTGFHRLPAGVDGGRLVRPALVVGDSGLMASQPLPGLAASAINALAHAIEALYTPFTNPVARMSALTAVRLLAAGLRAERPRANDLSEGALLAGYASGLAGYAVHHVVCQTIVRIGGTPHAETNATVLPHSVRLMTGRAAGPIGELARALGGARDAPAAAPLVEELVARAEVPGLHALGLSPRRAKDVAKQAAARQELQNTPDPPSQDELHALVEAAL